MSERPRRNCLTKNQFCNRPVKYFQQNDAFIQDRPVKSIAWPFYGKNNTFTCYVEFYDSNRRKLFDYRDICQNVPGHNLAIEHTPSYFHKTAYVRFLNNLDI